MSFKITPELINDMMDSGGFYTAFPTEFAVTVLVLPVLVSISASLLQMTLSLFMKPMFSFGVLAVIMLAASYLKIAILPGSYAMAIRSKYVIYRGFEPAVGIVLSIGMLIVAVLVGSIRFKRYDILSKE